MNKKLLAQFGFSRVLILFLLVLCISVIISVVLPLTARAQTEPPPGTAVPGCPAGSTNPACAGTPGNPTPTGSPNTNPSTGNPAGGYTMLEPLPFLTGEVKFANYLNAVFQILMIGGSILAVVMIVVGGVQYMTSDVLGTKEAGRERIKNAVFGLILLLCTYIILRTINPDLLTFKILTDAVGSANAPSAQTVFPEVAGVPPITTPTVWSCWNILNPITSGACIFGAQNAYNNFSSQCYSAGGAPSETCASGTCTYKCLSRQGFTPGQ